MLLDAAISTKDYTLDDGAAGPEGDELVMAECDVLKPDYPLLNSLNNRRDIISGE
jgi:hypothetical protein